DTGLQTRVVHQLRVVTSMPQGEWEDTHQRTVPVSGLLTSPGLERGDAGLHSSDGAPGLDPTIEYSAIHGQVAALVPGDEPSAEVLGIESATVEQRCEQAQGLGAIVAPGARRSVLVGPDEAHRGLGLEVLQRGQRAGAAELVRNSDGVPHQQAPE